MSKPINRTLEKYIENLDKVGFFGIFVILTLVLSLIISSFISTGAGFIRFSSIYADLTLIQLLILLSTGIISILLIGVFLSGLISTIKLQETLDHVTYHRVMKTFKTHVWKICGYLIILTLSSVTLGTILSYLRAPTILIHIIILIPWILFIFTPQVAVIENFGIQGSMKDALKFIKDNPLPLTKYLALGFILMFLLVILEAGLGQYFIWKHKILALILVSFIVLPLLQIYATELYLKRYPLTGM